MFRMLNVDILSHAKLIYFLFKEEIEKVHKEDARGVRHGQGQGQSERHRTRDTNPLEHMKTNVFSQWWARKQGQSNEEFYLFNIYAPCDRAAQKLLWDSLSLRLQQLRGRKVCVCGDFNDVWCSEERRSVNVRHSSLDFSHFNSFIGDNSLHDLPLGGRKFTWFKGDGRSMSRLDRFLLSEDWCLAWPNCLQLAQLWGLSDHCPLVLSVHEENWGPRPSRLLKCWTDIPGYKQFVGVGIGQARPGFDRPEPGLRNKSQA
uniref:Reverse transcriptase-beet retrotransposon, putative n=1 Tax=Medicago truncatula TaxID=3880 RepID=Q2HTR5_MEDTR|nr:reverse transcriptase - beet retrotransposon, putative [Medicago truncatula]